MSTQFTVVIPTRNRVNLLSRALESLARQTFSQFDVVVVDDGSTEDIAAGIARFPKLSIRLLSTGGKGAPFARNMGTDAAQGEFIAYLDSDDVFLPDKLEVVARTIAGGQADIVVGPGFVWRGEPRVQLRPSRPPRSDEDLSEFYFVADERIQTSCFVVRTSAAQAVRWDERLRKVQDPDFMIRLVRAGKRLVYVDQPLSVLYDDTPVGRISNNNSEANMRDWLARSDGILTPRARQGFELYALAYEVSLRNKGAALGMVGRNAFAGAVPPKVLAKSAFRVVAPQAMFKKLAQLMLARDQGASRPELATFLAEVETAAARRAGTEVTHNAD